MSIYKQLTREQRYQIKALLDTGTSQKRISKVLCVSPSTISRELRRNKGKHGYRPKQAHKKALARRKGKSKTRLNPEIWVLVETNLLAAWSPEQISGRLKLKRIMISHESIYQGSALSQTQGRN